MAHAAALRITLASTLLLGACSIAATAPADPHRSSGDASPPRRDAGVALPEDDPELPEDVGSNPYVMAAHDPFSTFAADVDTASYDIFVRAATEGGLPDPASVRLEEYVNAFDYAYPTPEPDTEIPFAIDLVAAQHPLRSGIAQLRVAIQGSQPAEFQKLPTNLVFLVDTSGSMGAWDKLRLAMMVMRDTIPTLNGADTISLVAYGEDTRVVLAPTRATESTVIIDAINGLVANGSTNGGRGIQMAYEQARAGFIEGGFNHVVLMTDGDFNVGITDTDDLVALIETERETGVTLTALGFGTGDLNDAMMERVSNSGNGVYTVITSAEHAHRYATEDLLHTAHYVAQDMKIQVEFNPAHVVAYRLLGYVNRAIEDREFRDDVVDAGEVGAGLRVTALYEVVLTGQEIPTAAGAPRVTDGEPVDGERAIAAEELVAVRVRWKDRGATSEDPAHETSASLRPEDVREELDPAVDLDFLFASAIAAFAEILHESPYADLGWLERIGTVAEAQRTRDADREQFVNLFAAARTMIESR